MKVNVKIKRLNDNAIIPQYAREGDAGFDIVASEDVIIEPGETKLVPTGLAFELPPHYEMQLRPRSGISLKTKLRVANAPATIDSGYRGEVGVIVDNITTSMVGSGYTKPYAYGIDGEIAQKLDSQQELFTYIIRKGDRIAQAVIAPIEQAHFQVVDTLNETQRGEGGFGSSGVKS
jgi:dUTP pyrophosphatase